MPSRAAPGRCARTRRWRATRAATSRTRRVSPAADPATQARMAGVTTLDFDAVAAAAGRIEGHARRTPVMTSATADASVGATLFFKCENLQRAGAFKFRG